MIYQPKRGSILAVTMLFIVTLSMVSLSILALSMTSHRLALHNEELGKARAVAESELESLYYQLRYQTFDRGFSEPSVAALAIDADSGDTPTTLQTPFLAQHALENWQVKRSLSLQSPYKGVMDGTGMKGRFTTVDLKVAVSPPPGNRFSQTVQVRVGRIVTYSSGNIFGPMAFYQGCDIELANSGKVRAIGDMVSNSSIFMGSKGTGTLDVTGHISYLQGHVFNTGAGADLVLGTADDVYATRKDGTDTLNHPNFTSNTDQVVAQANQVASMTSPVNLLGGVDLTALQANNPDLFPTENDIQRSLIVPPPTAGNANEYSTTALAATDDVSIGARRTYTRAAQGGLIITVEANGAVRVEKPRADGTLELFNPPAGLTGLITTVTNFSDRREGVDVKVTEIDVGVLNTLVGYTQGAPATAYPDFNGVLYVNLKFGGVGDPSSNPSAVRLKNATVTPHTKITKDGVAPDGGGFSVATNGALYVKGSYNTMNPDGTTKSVGSDINPSILMADTVTVLSDAWDDANSASGIDQRIASSLTMDNDGNPIVKLNCAIATGNTRAATGLAGDGVQNLIRYLEDWTGITASFNGTLCRLFDSKMFTAGFVDPSEGDVYRVPAVREFAPDPQLEDRPPPGSMISGKIERGRFYYW